VREISPAGGGQKKDRGGEEGVLLIERVTDTMTQISLTAYLKALMYMAPSLQKIGEKNIPDFPFDKMGRMSTGYD